MSTQNQREVAIRVFAAEFNDASHKFKNGDDEFSPSYLLLPTGAAANRVFIVGTITEKENIGDDSEYWRARVVDPTGTFFVYAGEYQQESADVIRSIEPPAYISVVGKPNTYDTEDGDVITSIRPESITVVDSETRDIWIEETARRTLDRINEKDSEFDSMVEDIYEGNDRSYSKVVIDALESIED